MLRLHLSTARFAVILAVIIALLASGVAVGVVGQPVLLGIINDAGSAATRIEASSTGGAFWMRQHGTGSGVRGDSDIGAGGVFVSKSANSYGLYAINDGAAGSGSAVRADGKANPALDLRVNSNSIDPIKVNSTGLVDNLNSDMVDYFHANSLSRVAWTATENAGGDGANGTKLSVTLNAPVRGYFAITASLDSSNFVASNTFTCQLNLDGNYVAGSARYVGLIDNANEEQDCSTNAVVSTCGGDSTITLTAAGVGANTNFDAGVLQVTFTPFNGAGSQPSIFGCLIILPAPGLKAGADIGP